MWPGHDSLASYTALALGWEETYLTEAIAHAACNVVADGSTSAGDFGSNARGG